MEMSQGSLDLLARMAPELIPAILVHPDRLQRL